MPRGIMPGTPKAASSHPKSGRVRTRTSCYFEFLFGAHAKSDDVLVSANGNEVVGGTNDFGSTLLETDTFLRGVQISDGDGVTRFTGIVPGWYDGRAPHIHMRVYTNAIGEFPFPLSSAIVGISECVLRKSYDHSVASNGTFSSSADHLVHTGQTFFGEDVYSQIAQIYPYTEDTANRTLNSEDRPYSQQVSHGGEVVRAR